MKFATFTGEILNGKLMENFFCAVMPDGNKKVTHT